MSQANGGLSGEEGVVSRQERMKPRFERVYEVEKGRLLFGDVDGPRFRYSDVEFCV
jgi:hypothetical protein